MKHKNVPPQPGGLRHIFVGDLLQAMECKHLVSIADLLVKDIEEILTTAYKIKEGPKHGEDSNCLRGKSLGMIFEKSSMRTRVSFEIAMLQLGGYALYLGKEDIKLGERESVKDVACVLSRYVDCIAIRTYAHEIVEELAENSAVPVINALSDYLHPCQALADIFTIKEKLGSLDGVKICFVGDGNNVARSLAFLCAKLNIAYSIASPEKYQLDEESLAVARNCSSNESVITLYNDPKEAVKDADVVYTDTWYSMGQEEEKEIRRREFKAYQVNSELLSCVGKEEMLVMHCLPAHRGDEITDDVIDGSNSIVYDQAENRLHVQKAILKLLMS